MKWIRKLYDWVLHWAETPYGPAALFLLAVAESSVFPIPPDVLLIALALGLPRRSFYFAMLCTVGSVLGGMIGYLIGYQFWQWVGDFFFRYIFSEAAFQTVQNLYQKNAFLSIFISGFTPIPYKVFTISAGVFEINFLTFFLASLLGRASRFYLVAAVLFKFGTPVKNLIDKYFNLFTVIFTILLVGGFILLKWAL